MRLRCAEIEGEGSASLDGAVHDKSGQRELSVHFLPRVKTDRFMGGGYLVVREDMKSEKRASGVE